DRAHRARSRAAAGRHGAGGRRQSRGRRGCQRIFPAARLHGQTGGQRPRRAATACQRSKIDLVFSDILMPGGMNGLEFGHAIRRLYPAMPVLLTTGYSDSARDAVQQGFVVLQKPFDLAGLEEALGEARKWKVEPAPRMAG